jgi:benzoylformate decarboxylase
VVFVVLDNAEYAAVRRNAASTGAGKVPGTELGGLDFSALARGMGCDAAYVETPGQLKESLHSAFNSPVPTLLHVRVLPWGS